MVQQKCEHLWKDISEDGPYVRQECTKCSATRRVATEIAPMRIYMSPGGLMNRA